MRPLPQLSYRPISGNNYNTEDRKAKIYHHDPNPAIEFGRAPLEARRGVF